MEELKDFYENTFSQKLNKISGKTRQIYQKTQGTGGFCSLPALGNRPKKPGLGADK